MPVRISFHDWACDAGSGAPTGSSGGLPSHPTRHLCRTPAHRQTGEDDAYFHLRKLGYVMVARNFRLPGRRGEIDLIGWDGDVLCFIEVKTRTSHAVEPAEVAVDRAKQRQLAAVAEGYRRHLPHSCQWRFDVLSVYYEQDPSQPRFELFKNCRLLS